MTTTERGSRMKRRNDEATTEEKQEKHEALQNQIQILHMQVQTQQTEINQLRRRLDQLERARPVAVSDDDDTIDCSDWFKNLW